MLAIAFGFSLYLSKVHHTTAHKEFVRLVNEEFDGEASFKDFDYSYFKSFPNVYVRVDSFQIHDSNSGVSKIGKMEVLLNLRSLWNHKIEIEKFRFYGVQFHAEVDSIGNKPRFYSYTKNSENKRLHQLLIKSQDILIKDSRFYFGNKVKGNRFYISVQKADLNLLVNDSVILVSGDVFAKLDTLVSNNKILIKNQPAKVEDAVFRINRISNKKELLEGRILAHSLELKPQLKMVPKDDGQLINFKISSTGNFDSFLGLFELHSGMNLKQLNPDAELSMSFNQEGFVNPFKRPYSEVDFMIRNAVFTGEGLKHPIENFSASGNYNNGKDHSPKTGQIVIDTLHADIHESYINARFKLENLADPNIDAHLISEVDLGSLVKNKEKYTMSGFLDVNLFLSGKISEIEKLKLEGKQMAKGSVDFRDVNLEFKEKGINIQRLNASVQLDNEYFKINSFKGFVNESSIQFKGVFDNLIQYYSQGKGVLNGQMNVNFDELDLDSFNVQKSFDEDPTSRFGLKLPKYEIDLNITGNRIKSQEMVLNNIRLITTLNPDDIEVESFAFDYDEGEVKGEAGIFFKSNEIDSLYLNTQISFEKLNLSALINREQKKPKDSLGLDINDLPLKSNVQVVFFADEIVYKDQHVNNFNTEVELVNNQILVKKLRTDLPFGKLDLFLEIDQFRDEYRSFSGSVNMNLDTLDLDQLLQSEALGLPGTKTASDKRVNALTEDNPSLNLPKNLDLKLRSTMNRVYYKNGQVDNLKIIIDYDKHKIDFKKVNFDFADGHVSTRAYILNKGPEDLPVSIYSRTDSLDLQQLLLTFNNFDQEIFNSENSKGSLSWRSELFFNLNKPFYPLTPDNLWKFELRLHDAEFKEIEPIDKTLFFIGHKAKDNLIVKDLDLTAYVYKQKILFKDLFMNNNISNMDLFGEVDMQNSSIDIGAEISSTDLFLRSKKKRIERAKAGKESFDKDKKIYLKMEGLISDHKTKLSSKKKINRNRKKLSKSFQNAEKALIDMKSQNK